MSDPIPQRYPLSLPLPRPLKAAIATLERAGARCRVVGGSVRDALLGLSPKDFDIEVYGLPLDRIANALASHGKTDMVGKSFAVVKLWTHGSEYDFAVPRRESKSGHGHRGFAIEMDTAMTEAEALKRRDFTINALLYDAATEEVIDYYGGKADLDQRLLRHVSPAFAEDPLRALRAMQFAGRFNLALHPETAELCASMAPEFWSLPKERIWGEWEKWATRSTSLSAGMDALRSSGWIRFFPELNALQGLPQDPEWHPEGDVWRHTLCCLDALTEMTDWASLPTADRAALAFAVLCHDLGKARCTRWASKRGTKRWISPGHDAAGVWLAEQLLDRLHCPRGIRDQVLPLVGGHHFLNTVPPGGHSDASLRRLSNRIHPATTEQLANVMLADHRGRPPLVSREQEARIAAFQARIQELNLQQSTPAPILLGRHLIAKGLSPSPRFKEILDAAFEAQMDGAIASDEDANAWLEAYLKS